MDSYEEMYPTTISYEKYERDIEEKEIEINNLQELLKKSDDELEESRNIIKKLMEELKEYEGIIRRYNSTL